MRRPKQKTQNQLEADCIVWNHKNPVGTSVEYHSVIGEVAHIIRRTRSEASVLSGHTAVIWLEGVPGCVALDACIPLAVQA